MGDRHLSGFDPEIEALLDGQRQLPPDPPPPGARDRVYARVAGTLALPALGAVAADAAAGSAPAVAPAAVATVAAVGKSAAPRLALAALFGAVIGGGAIYLATRVPPAPAPAPVAAAPVASPVAPAVPVAPLTAVAPPVEIGPLPDAPGSDPARVQGARLRGKVALRPRTAAAPAPSVAAAAPATEGLAAEHALLERGRAALALGDPKGALAALRAHAERFPLGQLIDERESLGIRALAAAGRSDEARARAAQFKRRFPGSIHLPAVDATLESLP